MSDGIPPFDLPEGTVLACHVWLNAITWRANPILLAAARANRTGTQGHITGSVTHYLPRDSPGEDEHRRVMFDWPRHQGRAADLMATVLGAGALRDAAPVTDDMVRVLYGMARRAPGWTDDEREVLAEVERWLHPLQST
jgi:hypothetical protein